MAGAGFGFFLKYPLTEFLERLTMDMGTEQRDRRNAGTEAAQALNDGVPVGLDRRIGTVISSPTSPSFYALDVLLNPGETVRPGAMLAALATSDAGEAVYVICRVDDILESNPHKDAQGATL